MYYPPPDWAASETAESLVPTLVQARGESMRFEAMSTTKTSISYCLYRAYLRDFDPAMRRFGAFHPNHIWRIALCWRDGL